VTLLMHSGIFNNHFIANCPQNVSLKNLANLPIFTEHRQKLVGRFFMARSILWHMNVK